MNKVFIIGRLTKDPIIRYTTTNIATTAFTVAVDRQHIKEDGSKETDFISIVVWRKQAENCNQYLSKGSQIAIDGRLQTRTYDDKDGKKVYVTEVVADNVQFLDTKKKEQDNQVQPEVASPAEPADPFDKAIKDFVNEIDTDENLPF